MQTKNILTPWSNVQMIAEKEAELNISGYIGIPEWWQFDPSMEADLIATKEKMQKELKEISSLKVKKIKVNVDSLGGDFNHAQAMATALIKNPAEIEIEYTGWSASAATIFGTAATDNNVSMAPTNMILIHEARGCNCGVSSSMRSYADMLDKVNNTMTEVYAKQTGSTKEHMAELMALNNGEGEWLTAEEAKAEGLIQFINEPLRAAANYDLSRLSKFGYNIPQNKLKLINMNLRFKNDKPINAVALQDGSILLHEGELAEGVELQKAGENIELKGEHITSDGKTITVDDKNKVVSIVEKPVVENEEETPDIMAQVAEILVDFKAEIEEKLKGIGSNHKVTPVNLTGADVPLGTQLTAKTSMRAKMEEIQKNKRN